MKSKYLIILVIMSFLFATIHQFLGFEIAVLVALTFIVTYLREIKDKKGK